MQVLSCQLYILKNSDTRNIKQFLKYQSISYVEDRAPETVSHVRLLSPWKPPAHYRR